MEDRKEREGNNGLTLRVVEDWIFGSTEMSEVVPLTPNRDSHLPSPTDCPYCSASLDSEPTLNIDSFTIRL